MTPRNTRHKDFRYLYNSNHKIKTNKYYLIADKEIRMIDKGWRSFWKRRGMTPPPVSDTQLGNF